MVINGENKTFTTPFISGLIWRKFLELKNNVSNPESPFTSDQLDDFSSLVPLAYNNQFTLEQFYEGTPHDKIMVTIDRLFMPTDSDDNSEGNGKK